MKHKLWLIVLSLLCLPQVVLAESHTDSVTITSSGSTKRFAYGGNTGSFEELIAGAPATVSIVLQGCMTGGTCDTLETNTSTSASQLRKPTISGLYLFFQVTASWTGGTNVSVTVDATVATASIPFTVAKCAAVGTAANPSAASCLSAAAGAFSCATNASTGTCVVSSTAVGATSAILVQPTSGAGTLLSVTCNTTADTGLVAPRLSSWSAGVSFTIQLGTFSTNPLCFNYWIVN